MDYLMAESELGRVSKDKIAVAINVLLSHLHNIALYESIGVPKEAQIHDAVADALFVLWSGLSP